MPRETRRAGDVVRAAQAREAERLGQAPKAAQALKVVRAPKAGQAQWRYRISDAAQHSSISGGQLAASQPRPMTTPSGLRPTPKPVRNVSLQPGRPGKAARQARQLGQATQRASHQLNRAAQHSSIQPVRAIPELAPVQGGSEPKGAFQGGSKHRKPRMGFRKPSFLQRSTKPSSVKPSGPEGEWSNERKKLPPGPLKRVNNGQPASSRPSGISGTSAPAPVQGGNEPTGAFHGGSETRGAVKKPSFVQPGGPAPSFVQSGEPYGPFANQDHRKMRMPPGPIKWTNGRTTPNNLPGHGVPSRPSGPRYGGPNPSIRPSGTSGVGQSPPKPPGNIAGGAEQAAGAAKSGLKMGKGKIALLAGAGAAGLAGTGYAIHRAREKKAIMKNFDDPFEINKLDDAWRKKSNMSTGRAVTGSLMPGWHGAVAGREGKKLKAAGHELAGAGVGQLVWPLGGGWVGAGYGTNATQNKGYYKKQRPGAKPFFKEKKKGIAKRDDPFGVGG